jgi:hypothetical protein
MNWVPRSGLDTARGLVWLPRMLEKARRQEAGRASGLDLMEGYLFGDNDFIDERVLRFLRTNDAAVSALVREQPDDDAVAATLIERSGRTLDECIAFSRRLRKQLFGFIMLEADEGRIPPGLKRTLVSFFYNKIVMPPVYALFRRAERKRPA